MEVKLGSEGPLRPKKIKKENSTRTPNVFKPEIRWDLTCGSSVKSNWKALVNHEPVESEPADQNMADLCKTKMAVAIAKRKTIRQDNQHLQIYLQDVQRRLKCQQEHNDLQLAQMSSLLENLDSGTEKSTNNSTNQYESLIKELDAELKSLEEATEFGEFRAKLRISIESDDWPEMVQCEDVDLKTQSEKEKNTHIPRDLMLISYLLASVLQTRASLRSQVDKLAQVSLPSIPRHHNVGQSIFVLKIQEGYDMLGQLHVRPINGFNAAFMNEFVRFCYGKPTPFSSKIVRANPKSFVTLEFQNDLFQPREESQWSDRNADCALDVGMGRRSTGSGKIFSWQMVFLLRDRLPTHMESCALFGKIVHGVGLVRALSLNPVKERLPLTINWEAA